MKLLEYVVRIIDCVVAPFTGARIETKTGQYPNKYDNVAPFTGTRIET